MTIFDIITSEELAAYWTLLVADRAPYMGEELFPDKKKMGLKLSWLKGANGIPIVLKPSAYDVTAVPRPRIGFEKLETQMPFFKESKYIDEELRQELNMILETNNALYLEAIIGRIFDDEKELLEGASAQRERMRMQALTTGQIVMSANGQLYMYDYHMPNNHKVNAKVSWSDPTAKILDELRELQELINGENGAVLSRAVCSSKVFGYFRKNDEMKKSILVSTEGEGYLSDAKIRAFLLDEIGLSIGINDKRYIDEQGATQRFVEDDIFVMLPDGILGNTWFGTTPEESDLMSSGVANVTIVDTGVAIATMIKSDPVNVETKVSQICLPDFPQADKVAIISVIKTL